MRNLRSLIPITERMRKLLPRTSTGRRGLCALLLAPVLLTGVQACTDLDENPTSAITPDKFYRTEAEILGGLASVYNSLRAPQWGYYNMSQITTPENIVPTRGSDWFDNGRWLEMHRHTWTANSPMALDDINGMYNDLFGGVARANVVLNAMENVTVAGQDSITAELRTLRAFYYYLLMDMFGGVPLAEDIAVTPRERVSRDSLFRYIEAELLASRENLPVTRPAADYGRVTKGAADAILANMYLNAEVFTGTVTAAGLEKGAARWQDAIDAADRVLNAGVYSLAANWKDNFSPNNESSPEMILVLRALAQDGLGTNFLMRATHYNQTTGPSAWNGFATLAETYNAFDDADLRKSIFLVGPQVNFTTGQPALDRSGAQLVYTPEIADETQATESEGARLVKFAPDPARVGEHSGNDFPYFRLAEMYLIKAEALNELGQTGAAIDLVNQLRARVFSPPKPLDAGAYTQATARDAILQERLFELAGEAKRRQDLIRHGKFTNPSEFKAQSEPYKILMPIPQTQLNTNPLLVQNPGY